MPRTPVGVERCSLVWICYHQIYYDNQGRFEAIQPRFKAAGEPLMLGELMSDNRHRLGDNDLTAVRLLIL